MQGRGREGLFSEQPGSRPSENAAARLQRRPARPAAVPGRLCVDPHRLPHLRPHPLRAVRAHPAQTLTINTVLVQLWKICSY